jgi:hypothetical protein
VTSTTACAEDEIVVYRGHGQPAPEGEGGAPLPNGAGGAPSGKGGSGATGEGGTAGTTGAGGRMQPRADAAPQFSGNGGGQMAGGSGGTTGAGGGAGRSGGTAGLGGTCTSVADCPSNFFCSKLDCSIPTGVCLPRQTLCVDLTPLPVCGCDGVTYWNDCLRQQNGVPAATPNGCTFNTKTCATSADCGMAGASCAHLTPIPTQGCGGPVPGTCWMTPLDCTTAPLSPSWMPCAGSPQMPPPRSMCVNTCEAIRSGQEFIAAMPGLPCR